MSLHSQRHIRHLIFDYVSDAEVSDIYFGICFIKETDTFYYLSENEPTQRDGKYYLNTGRGGTTRLIGFSGRYGVNAPLTKWKFASLESFIIPEFTQVAIHTRPILLEEGSTIILEEGADLILAE